jgi:hypothetical protein
VTACPPPRSSSQVVAALARALQLTRAERDHLHSLAGLQPPGDRFISDHISPGVQRLLTRLGDVAVAVFAADWRLLRRTIDGSEYFAQLWRAGAVGEHAEDRKTVEHPTVGEITVDCDHLHAGDADLKIVAMTAPAGSEDASRIELARVTVSAGV